MEEPVRRITARVSETVRRTLEQAAETLGATINQFMVQAAYREARLIVEHETVIQLSQAGARTMLRLLDQPPEPNDRLKKAMKNYRRRACVAH